MIQGLPSSVIGWLAGRMVAGWQAGRGFTWFSLAQNFEAVLTRLVTLFGDAIFSKKKTNILKKIF